MKHQCNGKKIYQWGSGDCPCPNGAYIPAGRTKNESKDNEQVNYTVCQKMISAMKQQGNESRGRDKEVRVDCDIKGDTSVKKVRFEPRLKGHEQVRSVIIKPVGRIFQEESEIKLYSRRLLICFKASKEASESGADGAREKV